MRVGPSIWFLAGALTGDILLWHADVAAQTPNAPQTDGALYADDPANAAYEIDARPVKLVAGRADEGAAPDSAALVVTTIFGVPVRGDMDSDGDDDALLVLVRSAGGTGTFYYAAVAVKSPDGYLGTNAVFLGDRIAPQQIVIRHGVGIANFADRAPGEPMTTQPSVGVSKYLTLRAGVLSEIAPAASTTTMPGQ